MDHVKRVLTALEPLCEPLHDVFTSANAVARERHPEFKGRRDLEPVLTHLARGHALVALKDRQLGEWKLAPQNNAGIVLHHNTHSIRVLHQLPDRSAPPPGRNVVRRAFWTNDTLSEEMLPSTDRLLALWGVDDRGHLTIRIVRPIGSWNFGRSERVDLSFWLPATGDALSGLTFTPTDEDIVIAIPKEEGGSSAERELGS